MMLVYYTALVFGYSLDSEKLTTTFWLKSYDQCIEAMIQLEDFYDYIADNVSGNKIYMWCDKSTVQSNEIIKPKIRPDSLLPPTSAHFRKAEMNGVKPE